MKAPRLAEAHVLLVRTFAVFSAGFGVWALLRARDEDGGAALAFGIGSLLTAAGCVVYLKKAAHLKR